MECILFSKFLVPLSIEAMGYRIKEMGFDGVDLPVRPGSQITHETAAQELPKAVKTLNEIGLSVPSIVTGLKRGDEPHAEEVLAAAAVSGVKMLRTASWSYRRGDDYWANMAQARKDLASLESLCEKHGVKANMQIHSGGCLNCNCAATAIMLKDRNPKWIGLQIDPGHLAISGEDYDMAFALTGEYLHSVNVKSPRYYALPDANGIFRWNIIWTPLAEGLVPWQHILPILKDRGYDGLLSIHGEYPVERSIELTSGLVKADLEYIRKILARL
ncbi:sugar phosphate isomerase/epimerase [Candidatus Poribacteria bacterium]|nr:sugar phosphate isomerase/epimerase [Candidatus Poribacteria bacterium]